MKAHRSQYDKFRALGQTAVYAWHNAKVLNAWEWAKYYEVPIAIIAEEEIEDYFDVYGDEEDEKTKRLMKRELEQKGCWCVAAFYQGEPVDSVGMCVFNDPTSPYENPHVIDMMEELLALADFTIP